MMFERWKKETTAETLLDMTQVWKRNCNGVKKGIKFTDLKNKKKTKKKKKKQFADLLSNMYLIIMS